MEKFLDQQKNWIFLTPDNLKSSQTPEETFGVDDASMTGRNQKPKKLLEQYWDSMSRDSQSKSNRLSGDSSVEGDDPEAGTRGPSTGLDVSVHKSSAKSDQTGAHPLLDQIQNPAAFGASFTDLTGSRFLSSDSFLMPAMKPVANDRLNQAHSQAADTEFRRMILPMGTPPLSGLDDPINSPLDQTRQPINPITPSSRTFSTGIGSGPGNGALDQLRGLNGAGRDLSMGGLDVLNNRTLGPSSLAPAGVAPAASSFLQAKPAMLEIPRPRF
jgi:hypothetical protein